MNCVTDSTQIWISGLTPGTAGLMAGLMTREMDGSELCLPSLCLF